MADIAGISCVKCNKFISIKAKFEGTDADLFEQFIDNVPHYQTFKYRYFKHGNETYRYQTFRKDEESSSIYVVGLSVRDEEAEFPAKYCEFDDSTNARSWMDFTTRLSEYKLKTNDKGSLYYKNNDVPYYVCLYSRSTEGTGRGAVTIINGTTVDGQSDETRIYDVDFSNQPLLELEYTAGLKPKTVPAGAKKHEVDYINAQNEEISKAKEEFASLKNKRDALVQEKLTSRASKEISQRGEKLQGKPIIFIVDLKNKAIYLKMAASDVFYLVHLGSDSFSFDKLGSGTDTSNVRSVRKALQGLVFKHPDDGITLYAKVYYSKYFKKSVHETVKLLNRGNIVDFSFDSQLYKLLCLIYTESDEYQEIEGYAPGSVGIIFI